MSCFSPFWVVFGYPRLLWCVARLLTPGYCSVVRTPCFGIQVHCPGRCFAPSPALLYYHHASPHILLRINFSFFISFHFSFTVASSTSQSLSRTLLSMPNLMNPHLDYVNPREPLWKFFITSNLDLIKLRKTSWYFLTTWNGMEWFIS